MMMMVMMMMMMVTMMGCRYHALHHKRTDTNFCLFMPLLDLLGGTLNAESWEEHKRIRQGKEC